MRTESLRVVDAVAATAALLLHIDTRSAITESCPAGESLGSLNALGSHAVGRKAAVGILQRLTLTRNVAATLHVRPRWYPSLV